MGHRDGRINEANRQQRSQTLNNLAMPLQLLHQLQVGADREQDLDQAGMYQSFRWDRGTAEISVKLLALSVEAPQRLVCHLPDLPQRMLCGNASFQIDIAEQRPRASSVPRIITPLLPCKG